MDFITRRTTNVQDIFDNIVFWKKHIHKLSVKKSLPVKRSYNQGWLKDLATQLLRQKK